MCRSQPIICLANYWILYSASLSWSEFVGCFLSDCQKNPINNNDLKRSFWNALLCLCLSSSDAETSYKIVLKRCSRVKSTVLSERIVSAVCVCYFKKANFQRSFTFFSLDRLSEQLLKQTIQVFPRKIKRGQKMPEIGFRNEIFLLRVSRGELLGSIDFSLSHLLMMRRSIGRDSIIRDKILDKRTLKPWFGRADDD